MACCDLHNGSGAAPVLQGWGGSNFLLRRWKFDLRGSTSEVFSLSAFVVSLASTSFHSSCQFLLRFRGHVRFVMQHNFTTSSNPSSEVGLPTRFSPKGASQHFHQHIFPLAPTFSPTFSILRESWLLRSAVTTPIGSSRWSKWQFRLNVIVYCFGQ